MKLNFLKYKYVFFAFSLIVIIGGIVLGLVRGFKFDIDFKGGTKIEADLKEEFNNNDIESIVKESVGKTALVQKMTGGTSSVTITTDVMNEEESAKVIESLKAKISELQALLDDIIDDMIDNYYIYQVENAIDKAKKTTVKNERNKQNV